VFTMLLGGAHYVVTEVVCNMHCIVYGVRTTVHCCRLVAFAAVKHETEFPI
jgi:hypothetical protein